MKKNTKDYELLVEFHTDGTRWIKCKYFDKVKNARKYHPNAKADRCSFDGSDDHYTCPDCHASWWVEHDG